MLQAIDDRVQQGDLGAIDRALRISKARRELWGLDAPVQIEAEVSPAMAALMQQWQALREAPQPPSRALAEQSDEVQAETANAPAPLKRPLFAPRNTWRMLDAANRIIDEPDGGDDHK
jgi:uncharacterized protein (DUF3084 family)